MRNYNFFQAIVMSFYSRNLYRDVAQNWGAMAGLYLLFLLTLSWAVFMYPAQTAINIAYKDFSTNLFPQMPQITFKDGEVITPENRPYYIKDTSNGSTIAVIDTSGQYSNLEQTPSDVLLTKNELIYRDKSNDIKIHKISKTWDYTLKPEFIRDVIGKYVGWAWVIIFPIMILLSFFYRLIQAVLYAVLGKLLALLADVPISYGSVLQIALVAITPAIVISTILGFLHISFHFEWLFYFILTMLYILCGIRANKIKL